MQIHFWTNFKWHIVFPPNCVKVMDCCQGCHSAHFDEKAITYGRLMQRVAIITVG